MRKILNCLSYLTLVTSFGLLILIGYWLNYPYKPIEFKSMKILTPIVKQGGILKYDVDYCKYMALSAEVTRTFNNGIIYATPTTISNNPTGCHVVTIFVIIPPELPATKYTITMRYEYQVNPLRKVEYKVTSDVFQIIQ